MQILNLSPAQPDIIGAYIGNHAIVLCDTTTAPFTVTLPDAFCSQDVMFEIVNTGSNTLTIQTIKSQRFYVNYNETFSLTLNPTGVLRTTSMKIDGRYIVLYLSGIMGNYPAGNYTGFGADGTMKMYGAATVFDEINFPLAIAKVTGTSTDPSFTKITDNGSGSDGIYAYSFSATQKNHVWCSDELRHYFKEGSDQFLHCHIYPSTNDAGDILIEFEYAINNINSVLGNSIVVQKVFSIPANSEKKHLYVDVATVSIPGLKISAGIGLRVCRRADLAADTYNQPCWITRAGIHYEKDAVGSSTETAK